MTGVDIGRLAEQAQLSCPRQDDELSPPHWCQSTYARRGFVGRVRGRGFDSLRLHGNLFQPVNADVPLWTAHVVVLERLGDWTRRAVPLLLD